MSVCRFHLMLFWPDFSLSSHCVVVHFYTDFHLTRAMTPLIQYFWLARPPNVDSIAHKLTMEYDLQLCIITWNPDMVEPPDF
jgi:hypothetical protein